MKAVMEQDMAAMQRFAADQEVLRMMQRFPGAGHGGE